MNNRFVFVLVLVLVLSSLIVVESVQSAITKPSVPEFTVKFVDHSYDVPPTYGVDPYTGKEVVTQAGYHVQEKTIEVRIKNQPFTPYEDANGNSIRLYYSIRVKGHFGDSWFYPDFGSYYVEGHPEANYVGADMSSEYTIRTFGLVGNNGTRSYLCLGIPEGGQVDFQVRAFIGYHTRNTTMTGLGESYQDFFTGETSDWSTTQTLTIDANPTASSDHSGLNWTQIALFAALGVAVTLLVIAIILMDRRLKVLKHKSGSNVEIRSKENVEWH